MISSFTELQRCCAENSVMNCSESRLTRINETLETRVHVAWIIDASLLPVTVWIVISVIIYGVKTRKWTRETCLLKKNHATLYAMCLVAISAVIPRLILTQVLFLAPDILQSVNETERNMWCEGIMDSGTVLYYFPIYVVYLFLWMKQRAMYSHPVIRRLTGNGLVVVSWIFIVGISCISFGVCLKFMLPVEYEFSKDGCVLKNVSWTERKNSSTAYYALMGASLSAQLSLLGLFIYPIAKNNSSQRSISLRDGTARWGSRARRALWAIKSLFVSDREKDPFIKTIRRSAACTAGAIFSDLLAMVIVAFGICREVPRSITNVPYDIGLVVNVFCIIATFRKTKITLTCRGMSEEEESAEEESKSQQTTLASISTVSNSYV